jgi:hypothetical protein
MNLATLNTSTFLLTCGPAATPVPGEIVCTNARAVFWPSAHFASNSLFTATITTGAMSAAGVPLVTNHTWTFTTGNPASVQLSGSGQNPAMNLNGGASARPLAVLSGHRGSSPAIANNRRAGYLASAVSEAFVTPRLITEWVYQAEAAPPISTTPMVVHDDLQPAYGFRRASLRPVSQAVEKVSPQDLPNPIRPGPKPMQVPD